MNRMPQPGEIYQHFKGNLYRIVTLAEHTESGETLVVYQALYGNFKVYARPLGMFLEKADSDKYPEALGKQRFTLIPAAGNVMVEGGTEEAACEVAHCPQPTGKGGPGEDEGLPKKGKGADAHTSPEEETLPVQRETADSAAVVAQEEFALDPRLLAFLEADSYEKKLEVYASLAGKADESILNTIAVSLDLELSGDTLEEQYETLKNCLLTLEKYECNRLR